MTDIAIVKLKRAPNGKYSIAVEISGVQVPAKDLSTISDKLDAARVTIMREHVKRIESGE